MQAGSYILNGPDQRAWNCVKHLTPWKLRFPLENSPMKAAEESVKLGGIDRTRKDFISY